MATSSTSNAVADESEETERTMEVVDESILDVDSFLNQCRKKPILDGKYYEVDIANSDCSTGAVVAICTQCRPEKKIKGSVHRLSNFATHLKRKHDEAFHEYVTYRDNRLKELDEINPRKKKRRRLTCNFSQEQFEQNVLNYILDSFAPLNTVDNSSFRRIFDDFEIGNDDVKLHHLSRRTLRRRLDDAFEQHTVDLRKAIATTAKYFCTTADIWTSRNRRFMGVTIHWIDEKNLMRKSASLACRRFPGTHSYDRIARLLADIHDSYGLDPNKIIATITDNGSNFVKAFHEYGIDTSENLFRDDQLDSDGEDESNETTTSTNMRCADPAVYENLTETDTFGAVLSRHFRCASHTLHLVATTDLMKIPQKHRRCKKIGQVRVIGSQ